VRVLCVLGPLVPFFLGKFIELCPRNSITDRCRILSSVLGAVGDGVNLLAIGQTPTIDGGLLTRRLVVLFRKFEEQGTIRIMLARILGVDVVVLHILVCHPTFDLLVTGQ